MFFQASDNNTIYENNFRENDGHFIMLNNITNFWTYLDRGNYWDNYTGSDLDGDGIGDIPHEILDDFNNDTYPLMSPVFFPLDEFISYILKLNFLDKKIFIKQSLNE